jgi:hypothetical protein
MSDEEDIAALVVDNGSGMCKGASRRVAGKDFQKKPVRVTDPPFSNLTSE